jgi:hypothetical protein
MNENRTCVRCGKAFEPSRRGHVFCSPGCRHLGPRLTLVPAPDQDAVGRLFDETREPGATVLVEDWHPLPDSVKLDLGDTVERRRRWYLALAESGRL